jgi:hypothetical protein
MYMLMFWNVSNQQMIILLNNGMATSASFPHSSVTVENVQAMYNNIGINIAVTHVVIGNVDTENGMYPVAAWFNTDNDDEDDSEEA